MAIRKQNKLFLQSAPLILALLALILIVASQGTAQAAYFAKKGSPATALAPGEPTTTDKIAPMLKPGNVSCSTAGVGAANGTVEFKLEGPGSFPYTNGQIAVNVTKYADRMHGLLTEAVLSGTNLAIKGVPGGVGVSAGDRGPGCV